MIGSSSGIVMPLVYFTAGMIVAIVVGNSGPGFYGVSRRKLVKELDFMEDTYVWKLATRYRGRIWDINYNQWQVIWALKQSLLHGWANPCNPMKDLEAYPEYKRRMKAEAINEWAREHPKPGLLEEGPYPPELQERLEAIENESCKRCQYV